MNKLLVICGPTATGKTSLGTHLAKKIGGEIVSADSRQVYKGMNIATGKDLPKGAKLKKDKKTNLGFYEFETVPVWLLDVVFPNQEFSVALFIDLAWQVVLDIWKRGKLPILVGGTGFYIKGVVDGIDTLGISPDWSLRRRLQTYTLSQLFDLLARLNSEKAALMNVSDRQNPRRLIRAIEVALKKEEAKKGRQEKPGKKKIKLNALFIGLKAPMRKLYERIDKRVEAQFRKGAKKEVKSLLKKGYSWDLPAMTALGYRVWREHFEKGESIRQVVSRWQYHEHAYARRQMTWFLKDKRINWFDITKPGFEKRVEKKVLSWYTKT